MEKAGKQIYVRKKDKCREAEARDKGRNTNVK